MSKFSNSWELMKGSARVLKLDKELLVFPLLSGIATILVTVTFIAPFAFIGEGFGALEGLADDPGYVSYTIAFLYYLALYTAMFFFNTALVGAAMIRLDGGDPTVSDGMRIALDKLPTVLGYAAIAATIGMVLRMIEERVGFLGRIIIGLIGVSWSLATYLTVPVLVTRDVGAVDAVKESASIFKETWGEQVVANAGMGFAFMILFMLMTAMFVAITVVVAPINEVFMLPLAVSFLGGIVFLALVKSALEGIYSAALYRFATTGDPGEHFNADVMRQAFRPKKKRW